MFNFLKLVIPSVLISLSVEAVEVEAYINNKIVSSTTDMRTLKNELSCVPAKPGFKIRRFHLQSQQDERGGRLRMKHLIL